MKIFLSPRGRFIVIIFLLLLLSLAACTSHVSTPEVKNGLLDLGNWNFKKQGIVPLDGTWRIYRNRFIAPDDYTSLNRDFEKIHVPAFWNSQRGREIQYPGRGYATYYTKILLPRDSPPLALKLYDIFSAYTLYINGKEITSEGRIGKTPETSEPAYFSHTTSIHQDKDELNLVLHISNFHHRNGGPSQSIFLGLENNIREKRELSVAIDIFLIATFLIMFLYHLAIYISRTKEKEYLFFALYCFTLAIFTSLNRERYFSHFFTGVPWEISFKLVSISFFFSISLFFHFLKTCFPWRQILLWYMYLTSLR